MLLVPKLKGNLLSVRKVTKMRNSITFVGDNFKIYNEKGTIIAQGIERESMYILRTMTANEIETNNKPENPESCLLTIHNESKQLWHRRLGHINEKYLDEVNNKQAVLGIDYKNSKLNFCDACVEGKMTQSPFDHKVNKHTSRPLELIHVDLIGPMEEISLGGSRYVLDIVDDYTRRCFSFFLATKSETFEKFVEFKQRRENELNLKIKRVRSDNGGEFIKRDFIELFKNEGIKWELTVPYTPQSNGVVERRNRTLTEKARTLLIESGLSKKFWAEAYSTATYVYNSTTPIPPEGKTPMELWTGRKPSVSHMRVFGCLAYYYIPKQKRKKLDPKARPGIFLGYSFKRKAYRIFDPHKNTVKEARSVKFDESRKGVTIGEFEEIDDREFDSPDEEEEKDFLEEIKQKEVKVRLLGSGGYAGANQYDDQMEQNETRAEEIQNQLEGGNRIEEIGEMERNRPEQMENRVEEIEQDRPEENGEGNQINNRRGRKRGSTKEVLETQNKERTRRIEELEVERGARRSERLKQKITEAANMGEEMEKNYEDPNFVPQNYGEAKMTPYAKQWKDAMRDEYESLTNEHKVWILEERKENTKPIKCKWVFAIKRNLDGTIARRKARLVARGFGQQKGKDYEESFAPVIRMESLRLQLTLAINLDYEIRTFDVRTAYLYGDLCEEVFLEQPEGFEEPGKEHMVCHLKKSLYGLPQSGRCWNIKLDSILKEAGMERLDVEPCIYQCNDVILGTYVDDLMIVGKQKEMDKVVSRIREKLVLNEVTGKFLGIEIIIKEDMIELSQRDYVEKLLKRFGMDNCKVAKSPGDLDVKLNEYKGSNTVNKTNYQELIGSLMYLATCTRPDIAFQVTALSQFNQDPREIHLTAAKRILRYLKGTKEVKLQLRKEKEGLRSIELKSDAGWDKTEDARSFSGYIVKLGNSLIAWKCKKQQQVADSTWESELIAMGEGMKELKWTVNALSELKKWEIIKLPILIKTDSMSVITWVKNPAAKGRTKYINRKLHFVRHDINLGNYKLEHEGTETIEADGLTKTLSGQKLQNCFQKFLSFEGGV